MKYAKTRVLVSAAAAIICIASGIKAGEARNSKAVDSKAPTATVAAKPADNKGQAATVAAKPADMSKPVQVFIMMGQSNMFGMGFIEKGGACPLVDAVKRDKLFPFLVDDAGNWSERQDVRNVQIMAGKHGTEVPHNEFLCVGAGKGKGKALLGVEYGVGHVLGDDIEAPVMLLKSCIGNRSLGWDLLPPGSKGYDFVDKDKSGKQTTYTYAGYGQSPMRWEKGTTPKPIEWHAGLQYDVDVANAKAVLSKLDEYYPGAKGYEVAGFFFWQGEKDCGDAGLSAHYEENLVHFIKQVREDFKAPNAKFVIGTLGEATKESPGNEGEVFKAQMDVDGKTGKYPEFKGNVATVFTHPMAEGGSGNGHYSHNAKVYMNVGLEMGKTMAEMLKAK